MLENYQNKEYQVNLEKAVKLRKPPILDKESALEHIKFDSSWIIIIDT